MCISQIANYFEDLPKSMQWGVYQDFADSLGEYLDIERASLMTNFTRIIINR